MQSPMLTILMEQIRERLTDQPPPEHFEDSVRQLREDYDLDDDAKVPSWFIQMWVAVLEGQGTGTVCFDQIGSDISSFLMEVSELISGWKHDEQGESIEIDFPSVTTHIHLSRESRTDAGTHCCSYTVTRTHRATRPLDAP
jgi:hypothetical protein